MAARYAAVAGGFCCWMFLLLMLLSVMIAAEAMTCHDVLLCAPLAWRA
jgi:hypothetical protein